MEKEKINLDDVFNVDNVDIYKTNETFKKILKILEECKKEPISEEETEEKAKNNTKS